MIIQLTIPFCFRRCSYCAQPFCKYDMTTIAAYAKAVLAEIEASSKDFSGREVTAVSIEGGCPGLMSPSDLKDIIRTIRRSFRLSERAQISLQTMPGDYSRALMQGLLDTGVNHWIFGVGTTERAEHELLERPYKYDALTMADMAIKTFSPRDLSFDLLYGIPEQTERSFSTSLDRVLAYQPDHLTLIPLRIENGTRLQQKMLAGILAEVSNEQYRKLYLMAKEKLEGLGYTAYDEAPLSTAFSLPDKENRFRLGQLHGEDQLGIGYGARSILEGFTYTNGHSLGEYLAHPDQPEVLANGLRSL
ncbi:MAG: hypothetical protein IJ899_22290 [Blautia sp.]|nr:hypothetical protein [Blautia sp.]